MTDMLDVLAMADILAEVVVRKPLDVSMSTSIIKSHTDLEFLISGWSMEMHAYFTSWDSLLLLCGTCH